jgi:hypothetical protein
MTASRKVSFLTSRSTNAQREYTNPKNYQERTNFMKKIPLLNSISENFEEDRY